MQGPGLNFNPSKWQPTVNSKWVKPWYIHTHTLHRDHWNLNTNNKTLVLSDWLYLILILNISCEHWPFPEQTEVTNFPYI